eukprot:3409316-Ditylum_brightwellii.AAC.1
MAGSAAAKELANAGIDYLWLEGRDEIGGRMRLSETKIGGEDDGLFVEEGANWSGGHVGNPIVELLKDYGVEMHLQHYNSYDFWH